MSSSQGFDFQLTENIQILDVGASAITEVPIYKILLDLNSAQLNAFEGDERQIEGIRNAYGSKVDIFKEFLFDGTEQTLYLCSGPSGMTSLFKPKKDALNFFNGFNNFGKVEQLERVQTQRMDSIEKLPCIDFIKMDIQGAELTVLQNGIEKLSSCLAAQLEVSWICLYENQPTFGDIDVWMRSQGFVPHKFTEVKRWSIAPTVFDNNFRIPGNQLLESDVIYIRDPLKLDQLSDIQLKKFAVLAHFCFESIDLCVFILRELEKRNSMEENSHLLYLQAFQNN
jgi:hypothetical protein